MFSHPRLQTKLKEIQRREENEIASLISIMYYMPLSTVVMHVPHVLDFLRRYQRLWRELTELGLTDEKGGQRHHSIRVLPPMGGGVAVMEGAAEVAAAPAAPHPDVIRGEVVMTVEQGSFVLLGVDLLQNITSCLQSHPPEAKAELMLSDGDTLVVGKLRLPELSHRMRSREMCGLQSELADMWSSTTKKRKKIEEEGEVEKEEEERDSKRTLPILTGVQRERMMMLHRSSLGKLTGVFERYLFLKD